MSPLRAIDLCCGAGGWIEAARGLPIKFRLAVDWAQDCCLTVKLNHPEVPIVCADVTRLDYARLRGIDLVLGAIPCEQISTARNGRKPTDDAMARWHALLDGMLEALLDIDPTWWAIENVIGMRKHLPIFTPYTVLNARHYSGQDRKRIFVGHFPLPSPPVVSPRKVLADYLQPGPYITTPAILHATKRTRHQWYTSGCKRVIPAALPSPTITDFGGRHSRGFLVEMADGRERQLRFEEAADLQGFPSTYLFVGSQTRAWKMVAQAVQIDLARAILQAIVAEASARPA
jgi:site-specific DNA-cytosine methylase